MKREPAQSGRAWLLGAAHSVHMLCRGLSWAGNPNPPLAQSPWGSPAGPAEGGAGLGCPSSTPMLAGAQRNPGVKVDPGFVAGSPAWPCVRRRLSFHYSGGATNCLDERGWVYVM